jgi:hypothetical protein
MAERTRGELCCRRNERDVTAILGHRVLAMGAEIRG